MESEGPDRPFRDQLIGTQLLDEAADQKIWEEARAQVGAAIEECEKIPPMASPSLFDDVFARPTPRLVEERAEFEHRPTGGLGHA